MAGRVVVVGLGPGGREHVTAETVTRSGSIAHRFLRTARHPSAGMIGDAAAFDDVYEAADRFEDVYAEIVERLVTAAGEHGEVLYAVPGSPLVLERTVARLRADDRVDVELLPAMSFLDVAWARLGIDPVDAGVRLVDGHRFATAAAGQPGPLLVAHTHANWVLSDIKLAADELDPATEVVILQALGTPDERVVTTAWADLDRTVEADHLTSLYVPRFHAPVGAGYVRFHQLARTLRERCPWDREQTHASLVPYLVEETYEVVDALEALDPEDGSTDHDLIEELGDLLYQIEFHATIAEQQGRFTIADVTAGIHDKLVRRHPHVFNRPGTTLNPSTTRPVGGEGSASDEPHAARGGSAADDEPAIDSVVRNWDQIKRDEKGRTSIFDGIPSALPSLAYAQKVQRKAAKVGFDWPDVNGALPKIAEEAQEIRAAVDGGDAAAVGDEVGDLLFAVVNVARHLGVDAETALRAATVKFRSRFEQVERLAAERGIVIDGTADLATLDALWDEVKRVR